MVYIITKVYNLNQLKKLAPELIEEIKEAIVKLSGIYKQIHLIESGDLLLVQGGEEEKEEAQHIADIAFSVKEIINKKEDQLFGYNILMLLAKNERAAIARSRTLFLSMEQDDKLRAPGDVKEYFEKEMKFSKAEEEEIYTVGHKPPGEQPPPLTEAGRWYQSSIIEALLSSLAPLINNEENERKIVHLFGPPGTGKSRIINEIIHSIYKEKHAALVTRTHTRFKKLSIIHPFINSVVESFLPQVGENLSPLEKKTWGEKGDILIYLKQGSERDKRPDHIIEDFYIAYNLYLSAYIRMMEKAFFPAIFVCDDIDSYQPQSLEILFTLLRDFSQRPNFVPILISREEELPGNLSLFPREKVKTGYFSEKEVRFIAETQFQDLEAAADQVKQVAEISGGKILPILHNLLFLKMVKNTPLPLTHTDTLWYIIQALDKKGKEILYTIFIAGGLLTAAQLTEFLQEQDLTKKETEYYVSLLGSNGLISQGNYLTFHFPGLKSKLEGMMDRRGEYIKTQLAAYVNRLGEQHKLRSHVLLFTFFINNNLPGEAFRYLNRIIKRKIDEKNFAGVLPFLSEKRFNFPTPLTRENELLFKSIIFSGLIRLKLLEGKKDEAGEIVPRAEKTLEEMLVSPYREYLKLTVSSFYLCKGEAEKSISLTKKALLNLQDLGHNQFIGSAYRLLGQGMLATGRLGDSADYFALGERFLEDGKHPWEKLKVLLFKTLTHFIQGELSKTLTEADKGIKIARDSGRREGELFLLFLKVRVFFSYGEYDSLLPLFHDLMVTARLYNNRKALNMIYAWMGRTLIFQGKAQEGIALLKRLSPTSEIHFFLSEAYFFQYRFPRAREEINKALELYCPVETSINEVIRWDTGFDHLEGLCFTLVDKGAIFHRLLRAFQAFLNGSADRPLDGIQILHSITREEKTLPQDPFSHFYFYLYSLLLAKEKYKETEDALTILNKSIKQLQERASKIDEPLDRTKYLNKNLWSARILNEGRKRKLI